MSVPSVPVTVVVPVFNGSRYLAQTLDSIHRQTRQVAEVLVVDDGSTDGSTDIARRHPVGARVLVGMNRGVAVARNWGLSEAASLWVTFLDQDDVWHPSRVERVYAWIENHPEHQLVATTEEAFSDIDELQALSVADPLVGRWAKYHVHGDRALDELCDIADTSGSGAEEVFDHRALLGGTITKSTSFFAHAELLRLAGGFAPHALAMDDYWLLVNASRLDPLVRLDCPTVFYRVHTAATSRSTKLALAFLSSAAALRLGGGIVRVDEGLGIVPGPLHEHLLGELLNSEQYAQPAVRRVAKNLAGLLWPDGKRAALIKAGVKMRAPALTRLVRSLRGLGDASRRS